jgi:hypothetical protein
VNAADTCNYAIIQNFLYEDKAMHNLKERYIIDKKGNRTGVILDIKDYKRLLEEAEELESIRAYDAAKVSGDEFIPFEQAVREIEKGRE